MLGSVAALVCILLSFVDGGSRTGALPYPVQSNLSCFLCNTVDHDGAACMEINGNHTHSYEHECAPTELYCTLVRVKYVLDGSREAIIWSVERNCTSDCQNGCITMGERTKLHMCRYCCQQNLCNVGTGRAGLGPKSVLSVVALCATLLLINSKLSSSL